MKILASIGLLLLLSACGERYSYHPASGAGSGAYQKAIGDNLYRVHYKALHGDTALTKRLALKQAASLTAAEHYDWFVVISEQMVTEQPQTAQSQTIVRLTCEQNSCQQDTYRNPYFSQQFKASEPTITSESILQIRLGKGIRPQKIQSYPASQR